ncbi:helix-turn-helix transcriptional regulator [Cellulomonas sp. HZM]|uniref:helix-turn-helix domain-containing protein n=1 Tax=Cellulomonas sp. HZM TaxID=1454010 RepID=UPI000493A103|nr:helix-turn-helix transcriptional regulator [Cellulomonas sp. HZM]
MQTQSHAQRVADEVRAAMARRRVTQTMVADRLNMSQAAVSRRLSGSVAFDVNELAAVADLLGIESADLLARSAS